MKRLPVLFLVMTYCLMIQGQEIEGFVTGLLEQYPKARLLDIYKSCFQDYMGAEHLVGDTATARAYLEQEIAETQGTELMPWYYEPCGINGQYVRVSLKAIHDGFVTSSQLLEAFVNSANTDRPSVEQWTGLWHKITDRIDQMELNLPYYEQDRQFIETVLSQGKYAISHSPEYRENYSPHYRIIARDIFERDINPLLPHSCCH